jgi:hypothetical protein
VKTIEEVIDVVGDFGPGPTKQETGFQPEDSFGMSFDESGIQGDQPSIQLQDQAMMPPQLGKTLNIQSINFPYTTYISKKVKTKTTVNKLPKR